MNTGLHSLKKGEIRVQEGVTKDCYGDLELGLGAYAYMSTRDVPGLCTDGLAELFPRSIYICQKLKEMYTRKGEITYYI